MDLIGVSREECKMPEFGQLWAILLAAGEGKRVRGLTSDRAGVPTPKQFWAADGKQSMLRWAIARATRVVPADRLVAVVAPQHRGWWSKELRDLPHRNIVVQPQNKGTAAGVLLPLLEILRRDPLARIVVFPSDHYVADERRLGNSIVEAVATIERREDRVVLLGMAPSSADVEYGWIVPAQKDGRVREVAAFVEKPDGRLARTLMQRGGVLNSLILVAAGATLLRLFGRAVPDLSVPFASWFDTGDGSPRRLQALYRDVPARDFSRDVLERSTAQLDVLHVGDCGWSDLGTPERLDTYFKHYAPIPRTAISPAASAVV